MKRSNRLVLLVGVFLAIVAFIGILLISQGSGGGSADPNLPPTQLPTVLAKADIPLGSRIKADQVEVKVLPVTGRDADAFGDTSQVIGKIVRQNVATGAAITAASLTGGAAGQILDIDVPPGLRAITVQVDQVTGVGTVITIRRKPIYFMGADARISTSRDHRLQRELEFAVGRSAVFVIRGLTDAGDGGFAAQTSLGHMSPSSLQEH